MASAGAEAMLDHYSSSQSMSSPESDGISTSPSSLGSSLTRNRAPSNEHLSKEAEQFLSNLENYLALGCLCLEEPMPNEPTEVVKEWHNVEFLSHIIAFNSTLSVILERLSAAGWIRMTTRHSTSHPQIRIVRLYVLPSDVGLRFVDRQSKRLSAALESLIPEIDVSEQTWQGDFVETQKRKFDPYALRDDGSLFWMFNKLPSPFPRADNIKEKYAHEALEDLLDPISILPGLKTQMYPYQRRSAGLMLQRESISTLELDPRLEKRIAPDGTVFYFGPRELLFLSQPRYYENCKGGILAESMGLGKTVICLATILATKDHPPAIPAVYSLPPVRPTVARLSDMAMSAINRKSVPWAVELDRVKHATGDLMERCRDMLQSNPACYNMPVESQRWNRNTVAKPPKKMTLACTTLIIVPQNLCRQWQSEIKKHVDESILRVLLMDDLKKALPPPTELRMYDIVLFTRGRFEQEIKDGADDLGRRIGSTQRDCRCPYIGATRVRDCTCVTTDDLYDSPLKHLHFKRLIIDEGHFFSNTNTTAVQVANKLVTADHRWVVSGTPAKDLLGVEVDMSVAENLWHTPDTKQSRDAALKQRRNFSKEDVGTGAIRSIGALASNFLRIKPWYVSDKSEEKADWDEYIYRHEDSRKRTYSGFSTCLRRTLRAMVVKTQPEDVERDITLPGLSHDIVRLEPSYYDKLTANLFTLVLTANAVTSERTDQDYLFHKNSQKSRSQLIQNLRQSAFFWTGFSEADVEASLKSSNRYLEKEGTACTEADRDLLNQTLKFAQNVLLSTGWRSLGRSHEIGLFVENWPNPSADHWAFDKSRSPLLTGVSQLLQAQRHVNIRAGEEDPGEGLSGAGVTACRPAKWVAVKKESDESPKAEKPILTKGIPTSSLDGEPILKRRSIGKSERGSPKKPSPVPSEKARKKAKSAKKQRGEEPDGVPVVASTSNTNMQGPDAILTMPSLPPDSPFLHSKIVGTTSAKLSYLISQVLKYYQTEKMLVFYDGENVAYYIAQILELLHIKHEIYAKSLSAKLKAEYVVRFDQDPQYRVLLMDVRNAAYGLNLPSASRIFFVNPVCRPNVEAQAIKRAHRIGQTRKVFVETLVLKGTIEDKMLERSKRMTRSEHQDAKALEDDGGIREIIQSARLLPMNKKERRGAGQMALLEVAQQLWSRRGWQDFTDLSGVPSVAETKKRKRQMNDETGAPVVDEQKKEKNKIGRKKLLFVDCTDAAERSNAAAAETDDDDEPLAKRPRNASFNSPLVNRSKPAFSTKPLNGFELPSPKFEPIEAASAPGTHSRRVEISQLMNPESSRTVTFAID